MRRREFLIRSASGLGAAWLSSGSPFEKDQAQVWSVERQHGDAD